MDPATVAPQPAALVGLAVGLGLRVAQIVQARRAPEDTPRARAALSLLALAGLSTGAGVALATGNPQALLALDPGAVAQALVDVVTTAGALVAGAAAMPAPKKEDT